MSDIKKLISNLRSLVTKDKSFSKIDSNIGITQTRLQKQRFASALNKNQKIDQIIKDTLNKQQISLPESIASLFKTIKTTYTYVPEFYQAINTIVDNILSPDSITKESLTIVINETDEGKKNQLYSTIKNIIDETNLEDIVTDCVTDFVLYGNAYIWIKNVDFLRDAKIIKNSEDITTKNSFKKHNLITENFCIYIDSPYTKAPKLNYKVVSTLKENEKSYRIRNTLSNIMLEKLDVLNVVPIYISKTFFGVILLNSVASATATISKLPGIDGTATTTNYHQLDSLSLELSKQIFNIISKNVDKKTLEQDSNTIEMLYSVITQLIRNGQVISGCYYIPAERVIHFKTKSSVMPEGFGEPYGMGVLNICKYLIACDISQLVYRLTRSGERRIFKINVLDDQRAANYIQEVINQTKRKEYAIRAANDTDTLINEVTMFDDYFIPVYGGEETVSIDVTSGGDMSNKIDDLEYFRKKLISGLGIPSIYLLQDDASESKYTLAQENIKFSRTIIKLQKYFGEPLTELIYKIYEITFTNKLQSGLVQLQLKPPRSLQLERMSEMIQSFSNVITQLKELSPKSFKLDEFITDTIQDLFGQNYFAYDKLSVATDEKLSKKNEKPSTEEIGAGEELDLGNIEI